jgi:hypothetical protein
MPKYFVIFLVAIFSDAIACSIVGGLPTVDEMVEEFDQVVESRDVIFRGVVKTVGSDDVLIEVLEAFKGTEHLGSEFWYRPYTNCEESYGSAGEERLFFGWLFEGSIQFSEGNGSVTTDDPLYSELLTLLRQVER